MQVHVPDEARGKKSKYWITGRLDVGHQRCYRNQDLEKALGKKTPDSVCPTFGRAPASLASNLSRSVAMWAAQHSTVQRSMLACAQFQGRRKCRKQSEFANKTSHTHDNSVCPL